MTFFQHGALFFAGGCGYTGLELIWRGRSHWSMFLAGGTGFLLLGALSGKKLSLPAKALCAGGSITALELAVGLAVNRDYRVWDYRQMPLNFRGQICLPYSLLWLPLGLGGMALYQKLLPRFGKMPPLLR